MVKRKTINSDAASWKTFEKLVARIESALAPHGAIVTSPDKLLDYVTQTKREVDASIRYRLGSVDILIIVECRERRRIQDTLWIEQLASKQQHLRAAKCVAVTSSGFSKAAIRKAQSYGIELRNIRTISTATVSSWRPVSGSWFFRYKLPYVDLSFSPVVSPEHLDHDLDERVNRELGALYSLEDPCLQHIESGELISVGDHCHHVINLFFENVPAEQRSQVETGKEYTVSFFPDEPQHTVQTSEGRLFVLGVGMKVVFSWIKDYALHTSAVFSYSDSTRDLVQGVELDAVSVREDGDNRKVAFHLDLLSNEGKISIWPAK